MQAFMEQHDTLFELHRDRQQFDSRYRASKNIRQRFITKEQYAKEMVGYNNQMAIVYNNLQSMISVQSMWWKFKNRQIIKDINMVWSIYT